jgi:hypothetical protein
MKNFFCNAMPRYRLLNTQKTKEEEDRETERQTDRH